RRPRRRHHHAQRPGPQAPNRRYARPCALLGHLSRLPRNALCHRALCVGCRPQRCAGSGHPYKVLQSEI
ncbi:hypothetical protein H4S01_002637, partial [Coemansia sp. RSA 2610]